MTGRDAGCHYRTLGVSRDASIQDIKSAWRKLSLETHPDVAKQTSCPERFKLISQAASILTNPKSRALYDQQRDFLASTKISFHRSGNHAEPAFHNVTHSPRRPTEMISFLEQFLRPRNLFLLPVAMLCAVTVIQYSLGIESKHDKQQQLRAPSQSDDLVQAWKNPVSGRYETPAPWDSTYRELRPQLEMVPRYQVHSRTR
jgi:curved DNA-binding protein CbpA